MSNYRQTRCAFVVIKLAINDIDYFLLRRDKDWNDLNLIGGHQEEKDNGKFKRTARREMFEELSALRGLAEVELTSLTKPVLYGPVWSKSAKCESIYHLMFYLARLATEPSTLAKTLSSQSMNYLVDLESLRGAMEREEVSAFLHLLETKVPGGLDSIPYSFDRDLAEVLNERILSKTFQKQLSLFPESMS